MSSIRASAVSITTSPDRMMPVPLLAEPRVLSSFSMALVLPRMTATAGTRPKMMPVRSASAMVNASTGRCSAASGAPGQLTSAHGDQRANAGQAERQTAGGAEDREHDRLGHELSHQPPLPRPERRPDRKLTVAACRAHQEQIGDVDARDQQHDEHAHLQHVEWRPHVADELLANPDGVAAKPARARKRLELRQPLEILLHDHLHLRVELLDRRARPQPRDHRAELVSPALIGHLLRREGKRHERGDVA